ETARISRLAQLLAHLDRGARGHARDRPEHRLQLLHERGARRSRNMASVGRGRAELVDGDEIREDDDAADHAGCDRKLQHRYGSSEVIRWMSRLPIRTMNPAHPRTTTPTPLPPTPPSHPATHPPPPTPPP